jgi:hypothetical protein
MQQGFGLNKDTQLENNASNYNQIKEFLGKKYTGMKVGGRHLWHYDKGEWKEKKVAPDKWEFTYNVKKRRAWDAPQGSGVPVGTQYHWYILADQTVSKLDANVYSTSMSGLKYKLSHKRAYNQNWNATEDVQRRHLIKILEELIITLKQQTKMEIKQVTLDNLLDTIQY